MITLGVETSCDETAVSLVEDQCVISSEVSSSVHLHSQYGGVVPEIASRFHTEYIYSVLDKALKDAGKTIDEVDLVSVTGEPGLPGSLLVGKVFADAIGMAAKIPVIGVNHVQAHVMSCFINEDNRVDNMAEKYPFLALVVSGGHTSLYVFRSLEDFEEIGRTRDDAIGEAFDKVAKILELGYPGGPIVEKFAAQFAETGRTTKNDIIDFPRALLKDEGDLDFSFSGIKTAVLYYWRKAQQSEEEKRRVCYSFQEAVFDVLEKKILRAVKMTRVSRIAVGGGVIHNNLLRSRLGSLCRENKCDLFIPENIFCTDNAAMVAVLGENLYRLRQERGGQ
ncbi:MAG: tRNA (adenosine(37)-N6)-threonylcarbamoyltransferase complex transferase subunit TsaD [Candidatus Aadella gelida]|nr:tRNA (adenosine(37)-N6)-threonylcarbamoyltransferase complex transferase subunit TsaD [Candidatus Aadella gelida]